MHAVIQIILDMQISKCNVISGYGKFWTLDEIFEVPGVYEKRIIFCGQLAGINLDS